jgi:hypothetical protein
MKTSPSRRKRTRVVFVTGYRVPLLAFALLLVLTLGMAALANRPPVARISVEVNRDLSPHVHTFDATNSSDSDGSIETYAWDFGDGSGSVHSVATHSYSMRGSYDASLVVIDDAGASTRATRRVYVSDASAAPDPASARQFHSSDGSSSGSIWETIAPVAGVGAVALLVFVLLRLRKKPQTADWRRFEFKVAARFRRDGWHADVSRAQKDGGYDILLRKDGRAAVAECKYWKSAGNVGVKDLRALLGVMTDLRGVSKAFFVTTSDFTSDAKAFAIGNSKLELVNGKRLKRWMSSSMNLEDA